MTKREIAEIITIMQTNYPDDFRNLSDVALNAKIQLWYTQFKDDSYQDVVTAVMAHIASDTNRFMPPVGVIKAMLVKIRQPDELTEMEAWELVRRACSNSNYGATEEFAKLPPVVRRLVGSPNQLREWAMMDSDTLNSVVASNFQRSYKVRAASEREYMALPSDVRNAMEQISGRIRMPELSSGITNEKRNEQLRRLLS